MELVLSAVEGPLAGTCWRFDEQDRAVMIGRSDQAGVCLEADRSVSRHHCLIEMLDGVVQLNDLGSVNGTEVNGAPVGLCLVRDGDRLKVGETVLTLSLLDPSTTATLLKAPGSLGRSLPPAPQVSAADPDPGGGEAFPLIDGLPPLDALLPAGILAAAERAPLLRCLRCGAVHPSTRGQLDQTAWFCDACRVAFFDAPPVLPGYQVLRRLGAGAMGAVYLATDERGDTHALKVLLPAAALSDKARQQFLREATEQARLDHPHVVRVHSLCETQPGIFCLAMEYVEGGSANDLLAAADGAGIDPRLACTLIAQALEGLDFAHRAGLVHRDVKDANIMVARGPTGEPWAKLSDFGLAKSYQEAGASGFTRTGELGGTVAYMAPEQILAFREARPAADLHAMGATLYRLLTGALPRDFPPGCLPLLVVLERPIVPVRERNAAIPAALAQVVERALLRAPEARWASATEMREALLQAAAGLG